MADAGGQEIQLLLQCSPVRRTTMARNNEHGEQPPNPTAECEVLSFPPLAAAHSPPKKTRVSATTLTGTTTPPARPAPAARAAPRRRTKQQRGGGKSLLDVSCDASCCDCANTTRDSTGLDCACQHHPHHSDAHQLTSLLGLSAINYYNYDEEEPLHLRDDEDEDDMDMIVPKILFPEEMMHGTRGPVDGCEEEEEEDHGLLLDDSSSDIDCEDERNGDDDDGYLNTSHRSACAHSSPFKDLTNVGGGKEQKQQKLSKEADIAESEATTSLSLSASFFHNLSSTIADSFLCGGGGGGPGILHHTPQASPVRCRVIPRGSPSSSGGSALTPHRPHHLPRPSPSRSLILSTPLRTRTPGRIAAASSSSDANRSTLSEMEDAVREHFRRLDCYANTGTPIRTPEKCEEADIICDSEDKVSGQNENNAIWFDSAARRNQFSNRAARPVRLQTARMQRLNFDGTLPSCNEAQAAALLEGAADPLLSARLRRVDSIGVDGPDYEISRASSFDDLVFEDENDRSCQESPDREELDADLINLIGCIGPISILNGDFEHDTNPSANIPSDDVCYDSDPGDVEQPMVRRSHFIEGCQHRVGCRREATARRMKRNLKSPIAIVQVNSLVS
jgi:hypothetical protein